MLGIVKTPNPVLLAKAKIVKKIDKTIFGLIEDMKKTILATKEPKGVGLAAPQVGKSLRIFITKPLDTSPFTVFINPEIIWVSNEKTEGVPERDKKYEGCLSIPTIWGLVHRAKKIKVRYQTLGPKPFTLYPRTRTFSGFLATIIQHETDHLNGILFTKRVLEQGEKFYKVVKNAKGEEEFEEIEL